MSSNDRKSTVVVQRKLPVERTNLYIHRHTSMHVGMYDCVRSEKSELGNQLSGILRKANKQTCITVCRCMYVCMRSDIESSSHSSPPQLKRVRVISACARACVCAGTVSLISLLCLFISRCTLWHNKHSLTHKQH
jgi:hypothetical protein